MFRFELLENGVDYLAEAVRRLSGDPDRADLKYAVLHLGGGVELLLKARLVREDWTLVFERPTDADEDLYRSGGFKSVGIWDTIRRLKRAGVEIAPADEKRVGQLRLKRNQLEHFGIQDSREAISASAVWALGFALDFIGRELEADGLEPDIEAELEEIRAGLSEMEEFVALREGQITAELEQARDSREAVFDCPRCLEQATIAREGMHCHFCGYTVGLDRIEQAADGWVNAVLGLSHYTVIKEGGIWPVNRCPQCSLVALVDHGVDQSCGRRFLCLACGTYWSDSEMDECARCGEPFSGEGTICSACFRAVVAE